jgi:hypothetical protein
LDGWIKKAAANHTPTRIASPRPGKLFSLTYGIRV